MEKHLRKQKSMESIKKIVQKEILNGELAGAVLAVQKNGDTVFQWEAGYADIQRKKTVNRNSIFRLYSMSKPITAVGAAILWERGELDYMAPLKEYLPYFEGMEIVTEEGRRIPAKKEIHIIDLLRMTSGLVYPDPDIAGIYMDRLFTKVQEKIEQGEHIDTQQLCKMVAKQPLAFEPGEHWRYGFSADVLGAVIEVVSGKRLSQFYREEIFEPLEMDDTGFYVPRDKQSRLVQLYKWTKEQGLAVEEKRHLCLTKCLEPPCFESAGAGIVSTLSDCIKFANMLADRGKYPGGRILGEKTIRMFEQNQIPEELKKELNFEHMQGYGYGNLMRIYVDPMKALTLGDIGEFGWDGWTGTYLSVNPREKSSIIFLVQRCGYVNPALIRKLRNAIYTLLEA